MAKCPSCGHDDDALLDRVAHSLDRVVKLLDEFEPTIRKWKEGVAGRAMAWGQRRREPTGGRADGT